MFLVVLALAGLPRTHASASCENDDGWYYKKEDKNCKWVKKKADARCKAKAKDANGVSVFAACAKACDVCDLACDDDADADAWYSKKDPEKDCIWVAKKTIKRCKKTDTDNFGKKKAKVAVPAKVACPVACDAACGGGGLLACEVYDIVDAVDVYLDDADAAEASVGGTVGEWDVSCVTDMNLMFYFANEFNAAIDAWNVSSVTNMEYMFYEARLFNAAIDAWDVSSVANMNGMFYFANAFNGAIDAWDVSSVTKMSAMFNNAVAFNGAIDAWDVSSVTSMYEMFFYAEAFDQDLNWCVGTDVTGDYAFTGAACSATSCGVTQSSSC